MHPEQGGLTALMGHNASAASRGRGGAHSRMQHSAIRGAGSGRGSESDVEMPAEAAPPRPAPIEVLPCLLAFSAVRPGLPWRAQFMPCPGAG